MEGIITLRFMEMGFLHYHFAVIGIFCSNLSKLPHRMLLIYSAALIVMLYIFQLVGSIK